MKKYVIIGIGNRGGGDDAIGPYIIDQLNKHPLDDIETLDVGVAPESYTDVIKKFQAQTVFLIDAVDMGAPPGQIRKVSRDEIGEMHISTHGIPLSVVMKYLETFVSEVKLIGIQPARMQGPMSEAVQSAAERIVEKIVTKDYNWFLTLK